MTEKDVNADFDKAVSMKDLEILHLSDDAKKEFWNMRQDAHDDLFKLREEQLQRKQADIIEAEKQIRLRHLTLDLLPGWASDHKTLKTEEVRVLAERYVAFRNDTAYELRWQEHVRRENEFLNEKREQRLQREAEHSQSQTRSVSEELKVDFNKARKF